MSYILNYITHFLSKIKNFLLYFKSTVRNTSKIKLSESTLDKIAEILGDDYTPKNNKGQEKNIQLAYERIEKMKKGRN